MIALKKQRISNFTISGVIGHGYQTAPFLDGCPRFLRCVTLWDNALYKIGDRTKPLDAIMNSQPPNDNSSLQILERIHENFVILFRERNWSKLLLLIVSILFLSFGPGIGFIIFSIIKEPPTWYWIAFWLTEGALFIVSVLLELMKRSADEPPNISLCRGHSQWTKFLGIFLLMVALVLVWKPIVVPLYQHLIGPDPNQNIALPCSIQEDCFSWGENILISEDPAFNGEEDWMEKCRDAWKEKTDGTINYKQASRTGFDAAVSYFGTFIKSCPNDPEAWIYRNNARAELDGNPIRIAISIPISRKEGQGAIDSQQVLRGVALAQEQINKISRIRNRMLLIGIVDDGYKTDSDDAEETQKNEHKAAENAANFLSKNGEIVGIIGHSSSDATEAAAKIYNQLKLVAVSPTSTAVRKSHEYPDGVDLGKYVFRTAIHDEIAAEKLAKKASNFYQRIAIVYDADSKYSRSFKNAFQKFFKGEQGEIVNDEYKKDRCDISKNAGYRRAPGAGECLEQAKRGNAEALLLVPSAASADDVKRLIELNFEEVSPLPLIGSDTMYEQKFLSEKTKDMVVVVPWHRHIDPSDFEKEAKELFAYEDKRNEKREPFKINWETATGYDATQALAKGLRDSQNCWWNPSHLWDKYAQPTCLRKELKNTLSDTKFTADGALDEGSVKFDQYGDRVEDGGIGVLVKVCEVESSKVNSQRKEFEFRRTNAKLQCIDS